jgi:hypothetical protein
MKPGFNVFIFTLFFILIFSDGFSQNAINKTAKAQNVQDSVAAKKFIYMTNREKPDISLSREEAIAYLKDRYRQINWNDPSDSLRKAIGQLLYFASNDPFDSTRYFLERYSFDSIDIPWDRFYIWDTIRVKIPVVQPPRFSLLADSVTRSDTVPAKNPGDTLRQAISPFHVKLSGEQSLVTLKDTILIVAMDTLNEVTSKRNGFPFKYYSGPYESDSIVAAIHSLVKYLDERDSSVVRLSGISKVKTPVWLNSKNDKLVRFWLHNQYSDSVTLWVGGISKNTIGLFLEEGILFRRPTKQENYSDAQLNLRTINSKTLQEVNQAQVRPHYWKTRSEASFILNQASLTNWVKGGESSISLASDITGYADYNNKKLKILSNNFMRLKFGLVGTGKNGVRKNLDLLETNSKINHKAFGKFDFSAIMLFKTQIATGYSYSSSDNSRTLVSKFFNPAILTIGIGLDYKPNKTTSLNFSPFSYKGTFVPDTAHIDQTKYGIPSNKKSLNEPGASLMLMNEYSPYKTISIVNRLQLFTNYIHNPQNIDVDWEMIATAKINWFTDVRLNTHLIYDDDTKTVVLDKNGNPEMVDGKPKKTARAQFKELLGFSFVFRF